MKLPLILAALGIMTLAGCATSQPQASSPSTGDRLTPRVSTDTGDAQQASAVIQPGSPFHRPGARD
jgi:hypothetical protein